jgi:hypothetical protein
MSLSNDSRFSTTANYFVPVVGAGGGSVLDSTVLITPNPGTTVASINTNVASAGDLALGSSTAHPNTVNLVEIPGRGYVSIVGDNILGSSPLNISGSIGGAAGPKSGLINMGTGYGGESLALGANLVDYDNIVLTPTATTVNTVLTTGVDVDINNGGVYRRSNASPNQAFIVPCLSTPSGSGTTLAVPGGIIPGLYAVLTGIGLAAGATASNTGCLMYFNGTQWSAGGSLNNPATGGAGTPINQYGVRAIPGTPNLGFMNGTGTLCGAGDVNVYFMLIMAGVGAYPYPLAPFV